MVTCMGFEPMNAAVRGQCVKPLHQQAMAAQVRFELTHNRFRVYRLTTWLLGNYKIIIAEKSRII